MEESFLGQHFFALPEIAAINDLFERGKTGLAFHGITKKNAGEQLKRLPTLAHFQQLMELLQLFQSLALSKEYTSLQSRPIADASVLKGQQRMHKIYHFIETNYQKDINVNEVAELTNLTTAAFCRYFKKSTHLTFTEFLNQYRVNQAKKLLLHDKNVTEACYESGFENLSHFNKTFKKIAGENPSEFKKKHRIA
jgi:AraC-like DNA-binding protein